MAGPPHDELLESLAPLLEAATPGPWETAAGAPPVAPLRSSSGEVLFSPGPAARPADVALVRAARQAIPRLLAGFARGIAAGAVRDELQQQLDALQEKYDGLLQRQRDLERLLGEALLKVREDEPPP